VKTSNSYRALAFQSVTITSFFPSGENCGNEVMIAHQERYQGGVAWANEPRSFP
jgi:hypothetical protein